MWTTPAGLEEFFPEAGQLVEPTNEEEKLSLLGNVNPADVEKAIACAVTKYGIKFLLPGSQPGGEEKLT